MKIFLNIYGITLFLFLTYLLLGENIQIGDTTLYFLKGGSVGLQDFDNLYSLSPIIMNILYFMVLVCVLVSIKFESTYKKIEREN